MRFLIIIVSFIGLALTIIPSFFVFYGNLELETTKILMLVGSLLWLFTTPLWINKNSNM